MKIRAAHIFLTLVLAAFVMVISGCSSTEPPVVPWDSPQGWQSGSLGGMMDQQHR